MPNSYTRTQYEAKGDEVGLLFISPIVPDFVTTRTSWQCKRCGALYHKSYRALCLRPNGCICSKALMGPAYHDLAKEFDISWTPGEWLPTNTKTLTQWTLSDGSILNASYSDLKWRLTNDLKLRLGMPIKRLRRSPADPRVKNALTPKPKYLTDHAMEIAQAKAKNGPAADAPLRAALDIAIEKLNEAHNA